MRKRFSSSLGIGVPLATAILVPCVASAASATWSNAATSGTWATTGNWSTSPVPGAGDTATFNNAGNSKTTIDLGGGVTVGAILFDTASAAAYTIGNGAVNSQTLTLSGTTITMNSTVAQTELFNAAIVLGTNAAAATYTFTNSAASKNLTFAGNISGGTGGTAAAKTLTVVSSGTTTISGTLSNGGATSLALTNNGTGTLVLTGSNTYTGATTISKGTVTINGAGSIASSPVTISGGALTLLNTSAANSSSRVGSSGTFTMNGGTFNFNNDGSAATYAQNAGALSITGGVNNIAATAAPVGSTSTLTFNSLACTAGIVNFSGGASLATSVNQIVITGQTAGALPWWMSVNGGVGSYDATNGFTPGTYTNINALGSTINNDGANYQINAAGSGGNIALGSGTTVIGDLLQNFTTAGTVATAGKTLQASSIHIGSSGTTLTIGAAAGDGVLQAPTAGGTLSVVNYNSNPVVILTINAPIADNTSASSLNIGGKVTLGGNNSVTGATNLTGANVTLSNAGSQTFNGINTTSDSTLTLNGSGLTTLSGSSNLAGYTTVNSGTLNITGTVNQSVAANAIVLGNIAGTCTVNLLPGGSIGTAATYFGVGWNSANAVGIFNQSGGTVTCTNTTLNMGRFDSSGTYNLTGGTATFKAALYNNGDTNSGKTSSIVIGGGTGTASMAVSGNITMGYSAPTATYNDVLTIQSNGQLTVSGILQVAYANYVNAAVNLLTGGTLTAAVISGSSLTGGTSTFNFDGGTLQLGASGTTLMSGMTNATIKSGGARIDLNNFSNRISQSLSASGSDGGLTLSGAGTLTLTGSNTYTGATTLNSGTLQLGNNGTAGSLSPSSAISGSAGAVFVFARSDTITQGTDFGTSIGGSLGVVKTGTSAIILNGVNTYTGATTITGGTLAIAGAGSLGGGSYAGNIAVSNSATLSYGSSVAQTLSGIVSGSGTLVQNGPGTLTLTGSNTFTGPTTIAGGTLQIGDGVSTSTALSGTITINSPGTLAVDLANGGTLANAIVNNAGGTLNVIGSGTTTFSGYINGLGTFNQNGSGLTILSATAYNFSPGANVNINAGALQLSSTTAAWGSTVNVGVPNGLVFGVNAATIGGLSGSGDVALVNGTNSVALTVGGNNRDSTYSGVLSGSGGSLSKSGSATLTLTGSNSYTGATTVSSGTLQLGDGNAGHDGVISGTSIVDQATLAWNLAGNQSYSGVLSGTGRVVKSGAGTLTLTGSNTYTGNTTISSGMLQIGDGTTNGIFSSGTYSIGGGATLQLNYNSSGASGPAYGRIIGAGTLDLKTAKSVDSGWGDAALPTAFTGILQIEQGRLHVSGSAALGNASTVIVGAGGQVYFEGGTFPQNFTIAGQGYGESGIEASLRFANSGTTTLSGSVILGASTTIGAYSGTGVGIISGMISGSSTANLTLGTSRLNGTVVLQNANTFGGGVTLSVGKLTLGNDAALGTGALTITSGTIDVTAARATTNAQNWNGDFTFAGSNTWNTGANAVTLGGNCQVTVASSTMTVGGAIAGSGYGFTKAGAGTLTLTGSNSFSGNTTVASGTLVLSNEAALQNSTLASAGVVFDSAVASHAFILGGLAGNGNIALIDSGSNAVALTVGNNNSDTIYSGALSGSSGLAKVGTGTLTLNGSNTYIGATSITGGTLAIGGAGSLGGGSYAGAIAISNSATLGYGSSAAQTLSGIVSGSGSLTQNGPGTLTLTGSNTYTGATMIAGGTIDIGGSTGNGSIDAGSTLAANGGTLKLTRTGGVTQSFNNTSLFSGVTLLQNTVSGDTLALGSISRTAGATADFTVTGGITTSSTNTAGSILGGWATVGGANWAVSAGNGSTPGNVTALGSYTNDTWAAGNNTTVTLASNGAYANVTTNSLRFNSAAADTVTLSGTNTIASGGILVTSIVGNNLSTITGGTLSGPAGGELVVIQNNTSNGLTIASSIADNAGPTGLTKSGAGTLTLIGNHTYTGVTTINAGTLQIGNGTIDGAISGAGGIVNNATLQYNVVGSGTVGTAIGGLGAVVKSGSGTLTLTGANTYAGQTALQNGVLTLDFSAAGAPSANIISGMTNTAASQADTSLAVGVPTFGNAGVPVTLNLLGKDGTANIQQFAGVEIYFTPSRFNLNPGASGSMAVQFGNFVAGSAVSQLGRVDIDLPNGASATTTNLNSNGIMSGGVITVNNTTWAVSAATSIGSINTSGTVLTSATPLANGQQITFTTVPTGANLTAASTYYVVNASGTTFGLSTTPGGAALNVGNSSTAGTLSREGALTGLADSSYATAVSGNYGVGNSNIDVITSGTITANLNSTRFNTPAANTLTVADGAVKQVASGGGGILVTPNVGNNPSTISGGIILGTGRRFLYVLQNNTDGPLQINSTIAQSGGAGGGVVKSGSGTLILAGVNTYSSYSSFQEGTTIVTGDYKPAATLTGSATNGNPTLAMANTSGLFVGEQVTNGTLLGTPTTTWLILSIVPNVSVTLSGNASASGTGSFVFAGGGGLGVNTVANTDLIQPGATLQIGNGGTNGSLFTAQPVTDHGTLAFNRSDALIFDSPVSGSGLIRQAGAGSTILTGANTYTGATIVSSGTLQIGNGGTSGTISASSVVSGSSGAVLAFNRTDALTFANVIGGDLALVQNGSGSLKLTGSNTFTGNTTVASGTLILSNGAALQNSTLASAGVVFDSAVASHAFTLGGLAGNGNIALIDSGSNAVALTVGNNSNTIYSGVLSGSGSLTKAGTGTLTLTGSSTYTGITTLSGGVVNLGVAETANTSGPLGKSAAANPGSIVLVGGTLQYSAANQNDYSGRFSTAANQQYNVDANGQNVTWAAALTSSGGSLAKSGSGSLLITGSNSYSGGTALSGGILQIGNANALGTGALTVNNGTLDLNGASVGVAGFSGSAGLITNTVSGTGALTTAISSGTSTYSGNIQDGAGSVALVKSGSGTLILSGSIAMSGLTAGAGQATLTQSGSIGTLNVSTGATVTLAANTGGTRTVLNISSLTIGGSFSGLNAPANASSLLNADTLQPQTATAALSNAGALAADAPEAVPEPCTWGLLLGASALLGLRRNRKILERR